MSLKKSDKTLLGVLAAVLVGGSLVVLAIVFIFRFSPFSDEATKYAKPAVTEPHMEWELYFPYFEKNEGILVLEDDAGEYLMAGIANITVHYEPLLATTKEVRSHIHLVKTDPDGNILWEKSHLKSWVDKIFFMKETSDEGFLIGGNGISAYAPFLFKIDTMGEEEWSKLTFPVEHRGSKFTICVAPGVTWVGILDDGGAMFARELTYSMEPIEPPPDFDLSALEWQKDVILKRYCHDGNNWLMLVEGVQHTFIRCLSPVSTGGYVLTGIGECRRHGSFGLVKIDDEGFLEWEKSIDVGNQVTHSAVVETVQGDLIAAAEVSNLFNQYIYLVKSDAQGNILWDLNLKGNSLISLTQTDCGGCTVVAEEGSIYNPFGGTTPYIVKVDAEGHLVWKYSPDKSSSLRSSDKVNHAVQTSCGGYIVTGSRNNNEGSFLFKLGGQPDAGPVSSIELLSSKIVQMAEIRLSVR